MFYLLLLAASICLTMLKRSAFYSCIRFYESNQKCMTSYQALLGEYSPNSLCTGPLCCHPNDLSDVLVRDNDSRVAALHVLRCPSRRRLGVLNRLRLLKNRRHAVALCVVRAPDPTLGRWWRLLLLVGVRHVHVLLLKTLRLIRHVRTNSNPLTGAIVCRIDEWRDACDSTLSCKQHGLLLGQLDMLIQRLVQVLALGRWHHTLWGQLRAQGDYGVFELLILILLRLWVGYYLVELLLLNLLINYGAYILLLYSLRALIVVVERVLLQFDHREAFLNGIYYVRLGCDRDVCLCTPCHALPLVLPQGAAHILKRRILILLLVALAGPLGLRGPMLHQWIAKLRESITHLHSIHIVGDTIYSQIVMMVRNTRVTMNLILDRRIWALLRVMVLADAPSTNEQVALGVCP